MLNYVVIQTGAGQHNGVFEDVRDAEDEDIRDAEDEDADDESIQDPTAIYANTQQVSRGIKLAALAAYVEDKKRHNGFKKEFEVSFLISQTTDHNLNSVRLLNSIKLSHTQRTTFPIFNHVLSRKYY